MRNRSYGLNNLIYQIVVGFVVSLVLYIILYHNKYLLGYDSYYYALQADWWFKTGHVRIPDSSFIHRAAGLLMFTGVNAETAVRIWMSFSVFLFLATFVLALRRCKSEMLALILFCIAVVSPSMLFIAIEFPKTFSFMIVFNLLFLAIKDGRINYMLLISVMFVSVLCHKISLVYSGLILAALLLPEIIKQKKAALKYIAGSAVFFIVFFLVYVFLIRDHVRIEDLFRLRGKNLMPGIISLLMEQNLPASIKIEIIAAILLPVFLLIKYKPDANALALPGLLILTAFIPAFGREAFNFGERFAVLLPWLTLLSIIYVFMDKEFTAPGKALSAVVAILAVAAGCFRLYYAYPQKLNAPYEGYDKIINEISAKDAHMLIVNRNIHFYYKYKTKRNAFSYEPEDFWDKTKIWRLVYGVTPEEFYVYLPKECGWESPYILSLTVKPYTLIREDCYEVMRNGIKKDENEDLFDLLWNNDMNPSKKRPVFLYKKHKKDEDEEFPAIQEM